MNDGIHGTKVRLITLADNYRTLQEQANAIALGKKVRITSGFNGQQFGRSKKSLKGKVVTVNSVSLYEDGEVSFFSWEIPGAGFGLDECEFI